MFEMLRLIYRITAVMKVKKAMITCMAASLTGQSVILVIIYVKTFKTDVTVFISNIMMCLMSH